MSAQAEVTCRVADGRIGVGVSIPDPIEHSMADHSYVTSVTLQTKEWRRTWWYGGGAALTEEPLGDDPPFAGEAWVPTWTGDAELTLSMRLRAFWENDEGEEVSDVWWWHGTTTVVSDAKHAFALEVCDPIDEPPFQPSPVRKKEPERGPILLPRKADQIVAIVNRLGAVLPGIGVHDPNGKRLLTETGEQSLENFQPPGDCYLQNSFGGPQGALLVTWNHRPNGMQFTVVTLPDGNAVQGAMLDGYRVVYDAVWNASGSHVAALVHGSVGLRVYLLNRQGQVVSESPVQVADTHEDMFAAFTLEWQDDTFVVTRAGNAQGDVRSAPRAVEPGWRQYGAGMPCSRTLKERVRTAWMVCAEFPPALQQPGTTIVAWLDDDESHGHVAVPDHGWSQEHYRFGRVWILDDGRIVAIGEKIWIVDPASGDVVNLGESGDYPQTLPIHEGRLYNRGPGPWWTALPKVRVGT